MDTPKERDPAEDSRDTVKYERIAPPTPSASDPLDEAKARDRAHVEDGVELDEAETLAREGQLPKR